MKLKRLSKNKFSFENGLETTIGIDIINRYDLRKREELSQEEYFEVLELAALSTSYYYLEKRDYSRKELKQKLVQKYIEKNIIEKVLNSLEEKEYLNDYDFAKNYIENKKSSKKKLEFDLFTKGVDQGIIRELLNDYSDNFEDVKKAVRKIRNREERKIIESLMRKGYKYQDILSAIKEVEKE